MKLKDNIRGVYFSSLLKERLPSFTALLEQVFQKNLLQYKTLQHTKDIWCRDYMPIAVNKNKFVLFNYNPSYLKGAAYLKTKNRLLCNKEGIDYKYSSLVLDGGNVVKKNDKVIITDRVFFENKVKNGDVRLLKKLETLLQSEIIIIPTEQNDVIGHSDGMVRFISDSAVLVNDYTPRNSSATFRKKLHKSLEANNLDITLIPYVPDLEWNQRSKYDIPSAKGIYINYLQVGETVIVPQFLIKEDLLANDVLKQYFKEVITLDCRDLASHGGLLNCISWN